MIFFKLLQSPKTYQYIYWKTLHLNGTKAVQSSHCSKFHCNSNLYTRNNPGRVSEIHQNSKAFQQQILTVEYESRILLTSILLTSVPATFSPVPASGHTHYPSGTCTPRHVALGCSPVLQTSYALRSSWARANFDTSLCSIEHRARTQSGTRGLLWVLNQLTCWPFMCP